MSKRKQDDENSDSGSEASLVNVDFDFFDPNPAIDFLALKRLASQLFQQDSILFNIHGLADLILEQPFIGSAVKTGDESSDPYAFLTVLNLYTHRDHPSISPLIQYILQKASLDPAFQSTLTSLFSQSEHHVGFIFCERLINMPVQVIPHMYRLLLEQLNAATQAGEAFNFSHLLLISRTYHLTPEDESFLVSASDASTNPKAKKRKQSESPAQPRPQGGIYSFHPEDDTIKEMALHSLDYSFSTAVTEPRNKESFGLDNRGRMMLIPWSNFPALVQKMVQVYAP